MIFRNRGSKRSSKIEPQTVGDHHNFHVFNILPLTALEP